jgi:hypothetical protein
MKMISNRITLIEAALLLGIDKRTVKTRLLKKGASLYSDGPNSPTYVALVQFEYAFNEAIISDLRKKYGELWYEVYQAYKENDLKRMVEIIQQIQNGSYRKTHSYNLTQREREIISDLTGKPTEL